MKKYQVSYIRRFKGKDNGVDYVSLELKATTPSTSKEGVYLGHKTYNVICKAEKFPADVVADDFVNCCVSFDKETGSPFAYKFSKCSLEEVEELLSSRAELISSQVYRILEATDDELRF